MLQCCKKIGGSYDKDHNILGFMLGPVFGNSHMASVFGIAIMAWGIYSVFGYLDP